MNSITIIDGDDTFTWQAVNHGAIIEAIEGFDYPTVRNVMENIPGRDGALYINSLFGRRRMMWEGAYRSESHNESFELRRDATKVLKQGVLKTLKCTTFDNIDLQAQIEVLAYRANYNKRGNRYQVEVVAPDYRLYSQTLSTLDTSETTSQGGMPIPTPIPASFSDTGGGGPVTVENGGTVSTPPTLIITGPGTNFTIQNITTGQAVTLNTTLSSGEIVIIDVVNKTVIKGTNQNLYGSFDATDRLNWLELAAGENEINFAAASGTDVNTNLRIQWRDAYLGV